MNIHPACRAARALFACLALPCLASAQDVQVSIDLQATGTLSKFQPGVSLIDKHLNLGWGDNVGIMNDPDAVARAEDHLTKVVSFTNQHIQAFGVDTPWPFESSPAPSNWTTLDDHVVTLKSLGKPVVLTLAMAPWWMRGYIDENRNFVPLTEADQWDTDRYFARVMDNKIGKWKILVQKTAERYLAPPYGVRHFQVWNELKGYYNPFTNNWDVGNNATGPRSDPVQHGYTYFYQETVAAITAAALNKGVNINEIKIGGPYVVMDSGAPSASMSHPSSVVTGTWGRMDSRALDAITTWVNLTASLGIKRDFIIVDGGNRHKFVTSASAEPDPFTRLEKISAVNNWIRSVAPNLPIWWAEVYYHAASSVKVGTQYLAGNSHGGGIGDMPDTEVARNAVGAYANIQQITSGASVTLQWGALDKNLARPPLYTDVLANGAQALPYLDTLDKFGENFGAGKRYQPITLTDTLSPSSPRVGAIATLNHTILVNKRGSSTGVLVNGSKLTLSPYQVRHLLTPTPTIGVNFIGGSAANGTVAWMQTNERAGVSVPEPYVQWNNASTAIGTLANLKDAKGVATTAQVSWNANAIWSTAIGDVAGSSRMMKGYLSTNDTSTTTVNVTGLPSAITQRGYDVYVYYDGANGSATRAGRYTLTPAGAGGIQKTGTDAASSDFNGTVFTENGNYLKFTNLTASAFTLTATPTTATDNIKRAPINGIQIMARPPAIP